MVKRAEGVADGQDLLPHAHRPRPGQRRGLQQVAGRGHPKDREVARAVGADELGVEGAALAVAGEDGDDRHALAARAGFRV